MKMRGELRAPRPGGMLLGPLNTPGRLGGLGQDLDRKSWVCPECPFLVACYLFFPDVSKLQFAAAGSG